MNHLWTQSERYLGILTGMVWVWLDFCLGGIDTPIKALAILICLDFITGVAAGYHNNELNSRTGARGLLKKGSIFICIMVAYALDSAMAINMFRGMVISGFSIIEVISLIENVDRMGYGEYIPSFIRDRLQQIANEKKISKGDNK